MDAETRDAVVRAFTTGEEVNPEYTRALFGQRKMGSQFGPWLPRTKFDFVDPRNEFQRVPYDQLPPGAAMSGCVYLRSKAAHVIRGAIEQVAALNELPDDVKKKVRLEVRDHGPQLVTDEHLPIRPADEMWLVLGPVSKEDSRLMAYTVIPGRLVRGINAEIDGQPESVDKLIAAGLPYAVKSIKDEPRA
jgi:hypothetical protein